MMDFGELLKSRVHEVTAHIQQLFIEDEIPWVVGYSGGKDSTATLQLVWLALAALDRKTRNKKSVHIISTDTLVEQPIVAAWVNHSLQLMEYAARTQEMPFLPHRLTPATKDSFWTNLIGRGYPAPRQGFRWCTSRLKIAPSNRFILDMVRSYGETILVLGTRKAESVSRARIMERYEKKRIREWLSPNGNLPNSWVFTPIETWTNDDVWEYLVTYENPWGRSNRDLLEMYRGANPDNECPLVIDSSTPSCGGSRFGCWVCTVVTADKSMEAMIHNDAEKAWLTPLLDFRNELGATDQFGRIDDRAKRDFRRLDGTIKVNPRDGQPIHGPYTKQTREYLLRRLLQVQRMVQENAPTDIANLQLITDGELREIRRIWVEEKHEFDDTLPAIYEAELHRPYPYVTDIATREFGLEEWTMLEASCDDPVQLELVASLLDIEQTSSGDLRSRGPVLEEFRRMMLRSFYFDETDALRFTLQQKSERERVLGQERPPELIQIELPMDGLGE
jgi:DNA sulfur modification protein DndC